MADSNPTETLQGLAAGIRTCEACRLCVGRRQAVPGEGNPRASIMFIGEAPAPSRTNRAGRLSAGAASS